MIYLMSLGGLIQIGRQNGYFNTQDHSRVETWYICLCHKI